MAGSITAIKDYNSFTATLLYVSWWYSSYCQNYHIASTFGDLWFLAALHSVLFLVCCGRVKMTQGLRGGGESMFRLSHMELSHPPDLPFQHTGIQTYIEFSMFWTTETYNFWWDTARRSGLEDFKWVDVSSSRSDKPVIFIWGKYWWDRWVHHFGLTSSAIFNLL